MKIALLGYGKMGKAVEKISLQRGHEICCSISSCNPLKRHASQDLQAADVFIDFSTPETVLSHIQQVADLKKPLVIGTTGWYMHIEEVRALTILKEFPLLYSPNFSIGIQLFLHIVGQASKLISRFEDYDVCGMEMHHNEKTDSPSGTALAMANAILAGNSKKSEILCNSIPRAILPHELHIASLRCGAFPGSHEVIFDSPCDTLTISHQARNREGFSLGAVLAAEWLQNKSAGLYTIDHMLGIAQSFN